MRPDLLKTMLEEEAGIGAEEGSLETQAFWLSVPTDANLMN